jgi:hypothetical protein
MVHPTLGWLIQAALGSNPDVTVDADDYFQRFAFCDRSISTRPQPDLGLVVVIPCFNEPDSIGSLASLWECERPACAVEVIVVVNSPAHCDPAIRWQNQITLKEMAQWIHDHMDPRFAFHVLDFPALPSKQAGVGLARKIGMDEAARRFDDVSRRAGVVVCYDADCRCERNYLLSIEEHFQKHPRSPGCSIYFEHPLKGTLDARVYRAIVLYELHLRYYVQALRYAGFPYAYHTVGSSMAVRADAYKKQGGMNKRQAGEDFYFLHKIIPLGHFTHLTDTTVFPSPRVSERVPFGTGKAIGAYLKGEEISTYPLQAFLDLRLLCGQLPFLYASKDSAACELLPDSVQSFLQKHGFDGALREILENTSSEAAFRKRFFHWFNGFQAMKFIHHGRDHYYGEAQVEEESRQLLALLPGVQRCSADLSVGEVLEIYRRLDRGR